MLTAEEARNIAGPTVEEMVECLLESVKKNAELKKRSLKTGWEHQDHRDFWQNEGYSRTKKWEEARKILEKLGYKVSFYYNDSSQFADIYTLIEW